MPVQLSSTYLFSKDPNDVVTISDLRAVLQDLIALQNGGGGGGGNFLADITVSLSGGKTLGKYTNGQTIPSLGLTAEQVMNLIAIEDIAPTYTVATFTLGQSIATQAEVGTAYASNILTATFTQNDAGALTEIRIQKNGADITPNGTTSPFVKIDSGSYILGNITYVAYSNYDAGALKYYEPSHTLDPRTPQVRNVNAPQAAENNFASNTLVLTGLYKLFYGDSATAPTNSADTRALPSNRFTNAGNVFTLNTGTTNKIFTVAMPSTKTLVSVFDATAGFDITGSFVLSTFNVNDAGGTPVSYNVYTLTNAVTYGSNHAFTITTT